MALFETSIQHYQHDTANGTHLCPRLGVEYHVRGICQLLKTRPSWFFGFHANFDVGKLLSNMLDATKSDIGNPALIDCKSQFVIGHQAQHGRKQGHCPIPRSETMSIWDPALLR